MCCVCVSAHICVHVPVFVVSGVQKYYLSRVLLKMPLLKSIIENIIRDVNHLFCGTSVLTSSKVLSRNQGVQLYLGKTDGTFAQLQEFFNIWPYGH